MEPVFVPAPYLAPMKLENPEKQVTMRDVSDHVRYVMGLTRSVRRRILFAITARLNRLLAARILDMKECANIRRTVRSLFFNSVDHFELR